MPPHASSATECLIGPPHAKEQGWAISATSGAQVEASITEQEGAREERETQRHKANGSERDAERGEHETDDRDEKQDRSGSELHLQPPDASRWPALRRAHW